MVSGIREVVIVAIATMMFSAAAPALAQEQENDDKPFQFGDVVIQVPEGFSMARNIGFSNRPEFGIPARVFRAVKTLIFLDNYHAIALPLTEADIDPGDVLVTRDMERRMTRPQCYPRQLQGEYLETQSFDQGVDVGGDLMLDLHGSPFGFYNIETESLIRFAGSTLMKVDPVTYDAFDRSPIDMLEFDSDEKLCAVIGEALAGDRGDYLVVQKAIWGTMLYEYRGDIGGSLSADAKRLLQDEISTRTGVDSAAVDISGSVVKFQKSITSEAVSQAVIPATWSREELIRITLFMHGLKGSELENMVLDIVSNVPRSWFDKRWVELRNLFGSEIQDHENWAERVLRGKERIGGLDLVDAAPEIDMRQVAIYAAARILAEAVTVDERYPDSAPVAVGEGNRPAICKGPNPPVEHCLYWILHPELPVTDG